MIFFRLFWIQDCFRIFDEEFKNPKKLDTNCVTHCNTDYITCCNIHCTTHCTTHWKMEESLPPLRSASCPTSLAHPVCACVCVSSCGGLMESCRRILWTVSSKPISSICREGRNTRKWKTRKWRDSIYMTHRTNRHVTAVQMMWKMFINNRKS